MSSATIIIAYYTAWSIYSRGYFVKDIPADKITHLNYAFAKIGDDGRIAVGDQWGDVDKTFDNDRWDQPLRGNFYQLILLKEKYPHLRTLISIGGWTWSGKFSDIALTNESRSKFAQSCVEFIQKYDFDGVDVDWEYPVSGGLAENKRRPEDKQNYVLLLKELRQQLENSNRTKDRPYLLTVATGAGTERIADMDLVGMSKYLDWINIMTYDFRGNWDGKTGHNAPLFMNHVDTISDVAPSFIKSKYNCHAAVQGYLAAGAPRSKLVMGLGLYGRGWQGVKENGSMCGFSQPASTIGPMGTWENGVFDYDHLKKSYLPTYTRYWDDASKVPFLYNASTGIWISYDDAQSIQMKCDYIKQEKLAGAMFWELSSDREEELIDTAFEMLNNDDAPSLEIPDKKPKHPYPTWEPYGEYQINDHVFFEEMIYRCVRHHQSLPRWTPLITPQLWKRVEKY